MIDYTTSKPPFQPLRAFVSPGAFDPDAPRSYQLHILDRDTGENIEVEWCSIEELAALRDEIDALLAEVGK